MDEREERLQVNRTRWDELVGVHAGTPFYDLDGFREGGLSLRAVERELAGDVAGVDLLHLQCHFGLDTLSWARLGARATGIDFSAEAIALARRLAQESGLDARFVCADVLALDGVLEPASFDVVVTTYGVLNWVDDLQAWARTIARALRPGGRLHLVEFHPFLRMFDHHSDVLRVREDYFRGAGPVELHEPSTYADDGADVEHEQSFQWPYPLGDVLGALLDHGLALTTVRELDAIPERWFPHLVEGADGWFRQPEGEPRIPFLLAVSARRDDAHAAPPR